MGLVYALEKGLHLMHLFLSVKILYQNLNRNKRYEAPFSFTRNGVSKNDKFKMIGRNASS